MGDNRVNTTMKLVNDFIEADIPIAEVVYDGTRPSKSLGDQIVQRVKKMGLSDLIKIKRRKDKIYILNLTRLEVE